MAGRSERSPLAHANPWRAVVWGSAACLLLLPLVAMQFTQEVDWGPIDFIVFGSMLLLVCGSYELATGLTPNRAYRAAAALALAAAFILVWMNLAVGLIGTPQNPANLMFVGVLAIGLIVAVAVRFDAHGMVRAMIATALAQVSVTLVAVVFRPGIESSGSLLGLFFLSGLFTALWVGAAFLFRSAARDSDPGKTAG